MSYAVLLTNVAGEKQQCVREKTFYFSELIIVFQIPIKITIWPELNRPSALWNSPWKPPGAAAVCHSWLWRTMRCVNLEKLLHPSGPWFFLSVSAGSGLDDYLCLIQPQGTASCYWVTNLNLCRFKICTFSLTQSWNVARNPISFASFCCLTERQNQKSI